MIVRQRRPQRSGLCGTLYLLSITVIGLIFVLGAFLNLPAKAGERRAGFHAMQSLLLIVIVPSLATAVGGAIPAHKSLILVAGGLLYLVLWLAAMILAFSGIDLKIPGFAQLADGLVDRWRPDLAEADALAAQNPSAAEEEELREYAERRPLMINGAEAINVSCAIGLMVLLGLAGGDALFVILFKETAINPNWVALALALLSLLWLVAIAMMWLWRIRYPRRLWVIVPVWCVLYVLIVALASGFRAQ